jgi:hypothetical protein
MKREKQLEMWLDGAAMHNIELDECCPDFSCCRPELLASEDERKNFVRFYKSNNQEGVMEMLAIFFERLVLLETNGTAHVITTTIKGTA